MSQNRACPRCYAPLRPSESPEGLCPKCLLAVAMGEDAVIRTQTGAPVPAPPAPADLAPHFPGLEVLSLIGRGGAGAVYRAIQKDLGRQVALKVLLLDPEADPTFGERFVREARAMASLAHPGIAAVHDAGRAGPHWFLVMELVDGPNLRQLIQSRDLAASEALDVVRQICDALEYAHGEGVVHRDIKPENVLVDPRGRVKLCDFGLAKLLGPKLGGATLTRSAQAMGTWHYMAPEQLRRPLEVDHRADIYSLGVVLYELLTGEVPQGRYAPVSERARADRRLDAIVDRALEQDPERRYQRVSGVGEDVARVQSSAAPDTPTPEPVAAAGSSSQATPARGSWMRSCLGILLLGLVALALMVWFLRPQRPAREGLVLPATNGGRALVSVAEEAGAGRDQALSDAAAAAWQEFAALEKRNARAYAFEVGGERWVQVEVLPFEQERERLVQRLLDRAAIEREDLRAQVRSAVDRRDVLPAGTEHRVLEVRMDLHGGVRIQDGPREHRTSYREVRVVDPLYEVVFQVLPREYDFKAALGDVRTLPFLPDQIGLRCAPAEALLSLAEWHALHLRTERKYTRSRQETARVGMEFEIDGFVEEMLPQRQAWGAELAERFGQEFRVRFESSVDWDALIPVGRGDEDRVLVHEVDGRLLVKIEHDGVIADEYERDEVPWFLERFVEAYRPHANPGIVEPLTVVPPFTAEEVGLGRGTDPRALEAVGRLWQRYLREESAHAVELAPGQWELQPFPDERGSILSEALNELARIDPSWSANGGSALALDEVFEFGYEAAEVRVSERPDGRWAVRIKRGEALQTKVLEELGWRYERFAGSETSEFRSLADICLENASISAWSFEGRSWVQLDLNLDRSAVPLRASSEERERTYWLDFAGLLLATRQGSAAPVLAESDGRPAFEQALLARAQESFDWNGALAQPRTLPIPPHAFPRIEPGGTVTAACLEEFLVLREELHELCVEKVRLRYPSLALGLQVESDLEPAVLLALHDRFLEAGARGDYKSHVEHSIFTRLAMLRGITVFSEPKAIEDRYPEWGYWGLLGEDGIRAHAWFLFKRIGLPESLTRVQRRRVAQLSLAYLHVEAEHLRMGSHFEGRFGSKQSGPWPTRSAPAPRSAGAVAILDAFVDSREEWIASLESIVGLDRGSPGMQRAIATLFPFGSYPVALAVEPFAGLQALVAHPVEPGDPAPALVCLAEEGDGRLARFLGRDDIPVVAGSELDPGLPALSQDMLERAWPGALPAGEAFAVPSAGAKLLLEDLEPRLRGQAKLVLAAELHWKRFKQLLASHVSVHRVEDLSRRTGAAAPWTQVDLAPFAEERQQWIEDWSSALAEEGKPAVAEAFVGRMTELGSGLPGAVERVELLLDDGQPRPLASAGEPLRPVFQALAAAVGEVEVAGQVEGVDYSLLSSVWPHRDRPMTLAFARRALALHAEYLEVERAHWQTPAHGVSGAGELRIVVGAFPAEAEAFRARLADLHAVALAMADTALARAVLNFGLAPLGLEDATVYSSHDGREYHVEYGPLEGVGDLSRFAAPELFEAAELFCDPAELGLPAELPPAARWAVADAYRKYVQQLSSHWTRIEPSGPRFEPPPGAQRVLAKEGAVTRVETFPKFDLRSDLLGELRALGIEPAEPESFLAKLMPHGGKRFDVAVTEVEGGWRIEMQQLPGLAEGGKLTPNGDVVLVQESGEPDWRWAPFVHLER